MADRRFTLLSEVAPQKASFLWQDRIPLGAVSILEGDPGCGKSTLIYDVSARLTTGRPMPGSMEAGIEGGVVLLQAEEDLAATTLPNLTAAGADIGKILVLKKGILAGQSLLFPRDGAELEAAVSEVKAKLIVLDPVTAFLEGSAQHEMSVRRALVQLAGIAERHSAAVILVRHLTKARSSNSLGRGVGSIGMMALARSVLTVGDEPTSNDRFKHVLALTKSNVSDASSWSYRTAKTPDGSTVIDWLGESPLTARDLAAQPASPADRSQLAEAEFVLFSIISEGPLAVNEVRSLARRAGVADRTLTRAKHQLRVESLKRGSGKGSTWLWRLPTDLESLRPYKDRAITELMDQLIHGCDDKTNA